MISSGIQSFRRRLISRLLRQEGFNNYKSPFETGEIFLIKRVLSRNSIDTAIDIGANRGSYTALLLEHLEASVFAFEPHPESFCDLEVLATAYPDRLTAINIALGDESGLRTLHYNDFALAHASLAKGIEQIPYLRNDSSTAVPVFTLDEVCALHEIKQVDFIKIDTEGFEAEVLRGASKVLNEIRPKAIQLEFNWHHLFSGATLYEVSTMLPDYRLFQLTPRRLVQRDPKDPLANLFMFSNYLFAGPDLVVP